MIIYNVTVKVTNDIATAWLDWLQKEHIPDMISTGCFTHANVLHLYEQDDDEGVTYAVQYHALNQDLYQKYLDIIEDYDLRHIIPPGITGLAQVAQGYTTTVSEEKEKLQYDIFYINNISISMDLRIIGKTFIR